MILGEEKGYRKRQASGLAGKQGEEGPAIRAGLLQP